VAHWSLLLRAAVADGPSARAFRAVCRALDACPDRSSLEYGVALAERRIGAWPGALRLAPRGWWDAARLDPADPRWRLVRALRLEGPAAAEELLAAPAARQIHHLALVGARIDGPLATALARWPRAPFLSSLELPGCALDAAGFAFLLAGPFERLTRLDLSGTQVGREGLQAALQSPRLGAVERLGLAGLDLGAAGIERLASSSGLARIVELDLAGAGVDGDALARLLSSPYLGRLAALRLAHNPLADRGARALVEWGGLVELVELDLSASGLGEHGSRWLFRGASRLRGALDLGDNPIGPDAAVAIAGAERPEDLIRLGLDRTELGPDGVERLVALPSFLKLRALAIAGNGIGASGALALSEARGGRALLDLRVAADALDTDAALSLFDGAFPRLRSADLSGNPLGPDFLPRLALKPAAKRLRALTLGPDCGPPPPALALAQIVQRDSSAAQSTGATPVWLRNGDPQ
jgi:hypothetical protein